MECDVVGSNPHRTRTLNLSDAGCTLNASPSDNPNPNQEHNVDTFYEYGGGFNGSGAAPGWIGLGPRLVGCTYSPSPTATPYSPSATPYSPSPTATPYSPSATPYSPSATAPQRWLLATAPSPIVLTLTPTLTLALILTL